MPKNAILSRKPREDKGEYISLTAKMKAIIEDIWFAPIFTVNECLNPGVEIKGFYADRSCKVTNIPDDKQYWEGIKQRKAKPVKNEYMNNLLKNAEENLTYMYIPAIEEVI